MPLVSLRDNDYTLDVADFEESYPKFQPLSRRSIIAATSSPPTNIDSGLAVEDVSVVTCDTLLKQNQGVSAGESNGSIGHNEVPRSSHQPSSFAESISKSSHHPSSINYDLSKSLHQPTSFEGKSSTKMSTMTYSDQGMAASAYYSKQWNTTSTHSTGECNIVVTDSSQDSNHDAQESKRFQPENVVEDKPKQGHFMRRNNNSVALGNYHTNNNNLKNNHSTHSMNIQLSTTKNLNDKTETPSLEESTLPSNNVNTVKHKNKKAVDIDFSMHTISNNTILESSKSKGQNNNQVVEGKQGIPIDSHHVEYIRQLEEQVAKLSLDLATCQSQLDVQRLKYQQQLSVTEQQLDEKEDTIQSLEHKLQMMQHMNQTRSTLDPYHKAAHAKAAAQQRIHQEEKQTKYLSVDMPSTRSKSYSEQNETSQTSLASSTSSTQDFQIKNNDSKNSETSFVPWGNNSRSESNKSLWKQIRLNSIKFNEDKQVEEEVYDNDDPFATYNENVRTQASLQNNNSRDENRRERKWLSRPLNWLNNDQGSS